MWRGSFLVALYAASLLGQAQVWCPPGAMWTFNYVDIFLGYHGVQRVRYVGDTVVGGHLAQELQETTVTAPWGSSDYASTAGSSLFTYVDSGVVYQWDGVNAYDTLMWFNAAPGQRWNGLWQDDFGLVVLDTATVPVNGIPLKRLVVQQDGAWIPDTLYERIGFQTLYLAGWSWFMLDTPWSGLVCYQDDSFSFTMPGVSDCGFTLPVPEWSTGSASPAFPNPGSTQFQLEHSGPGVLRLFDTYGREVVRSALVGDRTSVNTASLAPGVFIYHLYDTNGVVTGCGKWVKE